MAQLNNITVIPRWERPSPASDAFLEMFYMKSGALSDDLMLSSVYIFADTENGDSSVWLDTTGAAWPEGRFGLVASSNYTDGPKMVFNNLVVDSDRAITLTSNPLADSFSAGNFKTGSLSEDINSASGIFRIGVGHFGVVLRTGAEFLNFDSYPAKPADPTVARDVSSNKATVATNYFDIWTVVDSSIAAGGKPRTIVHSFTLYGAGFSNIVSLTEPIMVNTRHTMVQKYINRGALEKLQVKTDHVVINRNIGQDVKNIFKDGVLENPAIRIVKLSDQVSTGLPFKLIADWNETRPNVQTDSADTIMYNWDTSGLETGTYQVQVSSTVLDTRVMSDPFHIVLR